MTTTVHRDDVDTVEKIGRTYLRTCKVAEWETVDGRYQPVAWNVPSKHLKEIGLIQPTPDAVPVDEATRKRVIGAVRGYRETEPHVWILRYAVVGDVIVARVATDRRPNDPFTVVDLKFHDYRNVEVWGDDFDWVVSAVSCPYDLIADVSEEEWIPWAEKLGVDYDRLREKVRVVSRTLTNTGDVISETVSYTTPIHVVLRSHSIRQDYPPVQWTRSQAGNLTNNYGNTIVQCDDGLWRYKDENGWSPGAKSEDELFAKVGSFVPSAHRLVRIYGSNGIPGVGLRCFRS